MKSKNTFDEKVLKSGIENTYLIFGEKSSNQLKAI